MTAVRLTSAVVTDAASLPLAHEPVPSDQVVAGSPTTGFAVLDDTEGREVGVWEMTPGAMSDVEADEVFVVLAGAGTVDFVEPRHPSIALAPGSVVRLDAGLRTVWTVTATLRKIYITP